MTVKILNKWEKKQICKAYLENGEYQSTLAYFYHVSPRTINRVLNEAGILTTVPRIKEEAKRVLNLMKEHNITYDELKDTLERRTRRLNKKEA